MKYSNEFKDRIFIAFKYSGRLLDIIKAIEGGQHNSVRQLLEWIVDDPKLYTSKLNYNGVRKEVREDKIHTHRERVDLYSDFMEMYNEYLDRNEEVFVN